MEEYRGCDNCYYEYIDAYEEPCRNCKHNYEDNDKDNWVSERQDAELEEKKKEEKGKKEIKLKRRPGLVALPVPIYERTDSEIPEKVMISFTNGTSAIYALHVDQPKPMVMESIWITQKRRSEGCKNVQPRRRRSRK